MSVGRVPCITIYLSYFFVASNLLCSHTFKISGYLQERRFSEKPGQDGIPIWRYSVLLWS